MVEMWFIEALKRKRDGGELAAAEWRRFVDELGTGFIPDYQAAALLMAVYFRGLSPAETSALTAAMAASGEQLSFGPGPYVDKHSTGGVGDAVTLVAVPWAVACGARVPKLSGRGLGHTGGTLDKLNAIPGLTTSLTPARFRQIVDRVGWAVAEAKALAPADKIIYALRDATATVDSRPLIVASILSKKFAGGAPAFVFDVKCGSGAFMPDISSAKALAAELVAGSRAGGRRAAAVVSAMDQPLGRAVGNALEVEEAAAVLRGRGPGDLREVARVVAAEMLVLAGVGEPPYVAKLMDKVLDSGAAFAKLDEMARAQGAPADWLARLPRAVRAHEIKSPASGFIARLDARPVAEAARALGAGRARAEDAIDPAAGIILNRKEGDAVTDGEVVLTLYYDDEAQLPRARDLAAGAFKVGARPTPAPLVLEIIR